MFSLVMHLFGKEGKKDFVHNLDAKTFFQLLGRWSKKLIFPSYFGCTRVWPRSSSLQRKSVDDKMFLT